jgi:hypothetical protein
MSIFFPTKNDLLTRSYICRNRHLERGQPLGFLLTVKQKELCYCQQKQKLSPRSPLADSDPLITTQKPAKQFSTNHFIYIKLTLLYLNIL